MTRRSETHTNRASELKWGQAGAASHEHSGRQPIPVAARYAPRYWAKHMNSPPPPVATRPGCVQSRDMCAEFQECW
jgi:hypothetical protein